MEVIAIFVIMTSFQEIVYEDANLLHIHRCSGTAHPAQALLSHVAVLFPHHPIMLHSDPLPSCHVDLVNS